MYLSISKYVRWIKAKANALAIIFFFNSSSFAIFFSDLVCCVQRFVNVACERHADPATKHTAWLKPKKDQSYTSESIRIVKIPSRFLSTCKWNWIIYVYFRCCLMTFWIDAREYNQSWLDYKPYESLMNVLIVRFSSLFFFSFRLHPSIHTFRSNVIEQWYQIWMHINNNNISKKKLNVVALPWQCTAAN